MLRRVPLGFKRPVRRATGSTFVELVVTMFLLAVFAALAFPIFWGTTKANTAHALENAAQQAELTLATQLPRLTDEVRPPYWENSDAVFQNSGNEWKAFYFDGEKKSFLILRLENETRLSLVTSKASISIDDLPGLAVDWWKKDGRIVGVTVQWQKNGTPMVFHAAWGAFLL